MAIDAGKLAEEWDNQTDINSFCGQDFTRILETIEFFNDQHYHQYVPTQGSGHQDFLLRFDTWLENVDNDDDRRVLFEFAPQLIYFGREEFLKLYQAAYRGPITRWLIDKLGLKLHDPLLQNTIDDELVKHTWFCPITDSMPISDFHHANNIGGVDYRPDFRSLVEFGVEKSNICHYMQNPAESGGTAPELRRIVLLEDFVGGGTQIMKALEFAASLSARIEVLFVPLIICPIGSNRVRLLANSNANLDYEPVLEPPDKSFINARTTPPTASLESALKELAIRTYPKVVGNDESRPRPYTPFGFSDTGATIVTYSNTPANTLPIVQHESDTWNPLFRRSARIR